MKNRHEYGDPWVSYAYPKESDTAMRSHDEELEYQHQLVDRLGEQCADQDAEIREADWRLSCLADELAFWKFQAVWHRAQARERGVLADWLADPSEKQQREAEKELLAAWQQDKAERVHAEGPREIGS